MSDQEEFDDDQMDVDPSQSANIIDLDEEDSESENESENSDSDGDAEEQLYNRYLELLNYIRENAFDYDNYIQLVQVAYDLNDLEKIRESCELFSGQFPLTPDIWMRWLQIEMSIATKEDELQRVRCLFQRAFNDYFSVPLAQQYAKLASKVSNPQEIWDEIIPTYGLDCMEGSALFKEWREFHMKSIDESPETIQKILNMFQYELSLPLSGVQDVYAEFTEFVKKYNIDVDWNQIEQVYEKSKDNLLTLLTFEEQLVSLDAKEHHSRAALFTEYIDKCKSFLNDQMIQIIYERMVSACCLNAASWFKYIKYLKSRSNQISENEKSPIFRQTVMDIVNRALRNCTWNADLYIEKIRLAEKQHQDVMEIVQQALEATNSDAKANLTIWLEYLSYTKRHTDVSKDKDIELLRKTMELGLDSLGRRAADPNNEFDKLCAWIQYRFLLDYEEGYRCYDVIIKNANNQYRASLWNEFAHFELGRGIDYTRKIFRRAIKVKNIDDFDAIMSSWKSFEYTHGSLEQIQECHDICAKIIENYNKYVSDQKRKAAKRKPDDGTGAGADVEYKKQKPNEKKPPFAANKKFAVEQKKPETKTFDRSSHDKDDVTVFLSNLSFDVTETEVLDTFSDLNIKNLDLVTTANGRGRGYGYLELNSPAEVEKALTFDRRPINGRPVYINKISRDKTERSTFKFADGKDLARVFVKGLPFDATKEELESIFGKFGKINDIRLVTRKDGKFKGIAYIDYDQVSSANKAVKEMDSQVLRNLTMVVAISNPPSKDDANRFAGNRSAFPGLRAPPPRSEAKPRLSFIPTSVQRNVIKPTSTATATNGNSGDKPSTSKSNDYFRQLIAKK